MVRQRRLDRASNCGFSSNPIKFIKRGHRRWRSLSLAALAVSPIAMLFSTQGAHAAQTDTWLGTQGAEWNTNPTINWSGETPGTGDTLLFNSIGITQTNSDDNISGLSVAGLTFASGAGAYVLTSDSGANDFALALTGTLADNVGSTLTTETINFAVNGSPASTLMFGSTNVGGDDLTLGATSTFGQLQVNSNSSTADLLTINNNSTVLINGSGGLTVGTSANPFTSNFVVTGTGGTLKVTGTTSSANIVVAVSSATSTGQDIATMNLSGLSNFVYGNSLGSVLVGSGQVVNGTMDLANANSSASNSITAATVIIGDSQVNGSNDNAGSGTSQMILGAGTNVIDTTSLLIGISKASGEMQFNTNASTGSVTIAGLNGGGVGITLGYGPSATDNCLGQILLAGHNATVNAGTVIMAQNAGAGGGIPEGKITFDTGLFTAQAIEMCVGSHTSVGATNQAYNATLVLGSTNSTGTFQVGTLSTPGIFYMGDITVAATGSIVQTCTSTVSILGGTTLIYAPIKVASNNNTANTLGATNTSTAILTLSGGLLNMEGYNIGGTGTNNNGNDAINTINLPATTQTFTLANLGGTAGVSGINNSGINMNGTGTLILAGTNTFTSTTSDGNALDVTNGTVELGSATFPIGSMPSGAISLPATTSALVLGNTGPNTFTLNSNIIGSGTVTQSGSATDVLTGASNYSGTTTVSAGTLMVNGSLSAAGAVNLNGGTLTGSGSVGTVTVSGGTLSAGSLANPVASLTAANVVYSSGTLAFNIGTSGAGVISTGGATFGATPTFSFSFPGSAPTTPATFALLQSNTTIADGGFLGSLGTYSLGRDMFTPEELNGNEIAVVITGTPGNLVWNGAANGTSWDVQTNKNWLNSGNSQQDFFYNNDNVTFNDSNGGHYNVTVAAGGVTPGAININTASTYTFTGGLIAGATGLTSSGAGTVVLQNSNAYTGNTTGNGMLEITGGGSVASNSIVIQTGALQLGSATPFTAASPTLTLGTTGSGATLDLNGSSPAVADLLFNGTGSTDIIGNSSTSAASTFSLAGAGQTFSGTIQNTLGSGNQTVAVTLTGGTLSLAGVNSYTGNTTVTGGNLVLDSAIASSNVTVAAGATLSSAAGIGLPSGSNLTSNGTTSLGVASQNFSTLNGGVNGSLALTGSGALTVSNGGAFAGIIANGAGGATSLSVIGNTLVLSGSNSYTAGTSIGAGATLQVGAGAASGSIVGPITDNGSLVFNFFGGSGVNDFTYTASATSLFSGSGSLTVTGNGAVDLTGGTAEFTGFTGPTTLTDSSRLELSQPLGSTSIVVNNGSAVWAETAGGNPFTNPVSINGSGWAHDSITNSGALRLANGVTYSGSITLTGASTITAYESAAVISGPITGAFELTFGNATAGTAKPDSITLAPASANTYGPTTPGSTATDVGLGATLVQKTAGAISTGGLSMDGGTVDLNGINTSFANLTSTTNAQNATAGFLQNNSATAATLTVGSDNTTSTFGGVIIDGSGAPLYFTKIGTGTLAFTNTNGFTGDTNINGGTLAISGSIVDTNVNVGTAGALTVASTGSISSTANLTVAGAASFTNNQTISTLDGPGTGSVALNGVSLTINNGGAFAGAIADGAATGSLNVNGGTLALSGANTYSNGTSVNNAALILTGSLNTAGTVTVNSNSILSGAGNGTTTGLVGNINVQGGSVQPGTSASPLGSLTATSLTFGGGSLAFNIGASSAGEIIASTATFNATPSFIFSLASQPSSGSTLPIVVTNSLTDNGFLSSIPTVVQGRTTFQPVEIGTNIDVVVTGGPANLVWIGNDAQGPNWENGQQTLNWNNNGSTDYFYDYDNVTFNDNSTQNSVNLTSNVTPRSVIFSNSMKNYTLSGSAIMGSTGLTLTGSGTLTLQNNNSYTGITTISGGGELSISGSIASPTIDLDNGTLQLVNPGAIPSTTAVSFAGTGTLDLDGNNIQLANLAGSGGVIGNGGTGSGATLTYIGTSSTFSGNIEDGINGGMQTTLSVNSGTLTLAGANTFTGATTINGGTVLTIGAGGSLSSSTAVSDNGTFNVNNSTSVGSLNGGGLITIGGSTLTVVNGGNFSGPIGNGTSSGSLAVTGGTMILSGANSYTGATTINNAVLEVTSSASLGSTSGGAVNISNGGTLDLSGDATAENLNFGDKQFNISGNGAGGEGAIVNNNDSALQEDAFGLVTLTGNASLGGAFRFDIRENNAVLNLNGNNLTKVGGNQISIVNATIENLLGTGGNIDVQTGAFSIEHGTTTTGAGSITYEQFVPAQFFNLTGSVTYPMTMKGNNVIGNSSTGLATLASAITLDGPVTLVPLTNGAIVPNSANLPLILAGNISGSGPVNVLGQLTTFTLSGSNRWNGGTNIQMGDLVLGSSTGLPAGTPLTFGAPGDNVTLSYMPVTTGTPTVTATTVATNNGILDLAGFNATIGGLTMLGTSTTATIGSSTTTAGLVSTLTYAGGGNPASTFGGALGVIQDSVNGGFGKVALNVSSGSLTLNGTNTYTGGTSVGAAGSLTIALSTALPSGNTAVTNNGAFNVTATDNAMSISSITGTGATSIGSGSTATIAAINQGSLANNGVVTLPGGGSIGQITGAGSLIIGNGTTSSTLALTGVNLVNSQGALSIAGTGLSASSLDIGHNALLIPDGDSPASAEAVIQQEVENGLGAPTSNGGGNIISSYAANIGLDVAYADASDTNMTGSKLATENPGDIVIEPALPGDTDLNGSVNIHDLTNLLSNFNEPGFWDEGNFNGHANVDISDLQALLTNFNTSTALTYGELRGIENLVGQFGFVATANTNDTGFTLVSVPEPASVGLIAVAGFGLLTRRRRK
jgi:fibronectin-binding autotransporter adhesin